MGASIESSPTNCIAQIDPPRVTVAIVSRRPRSLGGSVPEFDVTTEAVKAPRIAIVMERITKLVSCGIISGAQIATMGDCVLWHAAQRGGKKNNAALCPNKRLWRKTAPRTCV